MTLQEACDLAMEGLVDVLDITKEDERPESVVRGMIALYNAMKAEGMSTKRWEHVYTLNPPLPASPSKPVLNNPLPAGVTVAEYRGLVTAARCALSDLCGMYVEGGLSDAAKKTIQELYEALSNCGEEVAGYSSIYVDVSDDLFFERKEPAHG